MNSIGAAPFPIGVYVGNPNGSDPSAEATFDNLYAGFAALMGTPAQFMDAYIDQTKPIDQWIDNASWSAWSYANSPVGKNMTPVIGLPMTSTAAGSPTADQFYKNFAAGNYDSIIQGMVKTWAANGFTTQYWRPGWEMNLSSMPSYAGNDVATQADWVAAFQHISTVLHAAGQADGVNVKVIWNPGTTNYSGAGVATQTVYPGNQYVDVIGADVYGDLSPYGTPTALYDWDKSGQVLNSSKPVYDSSLQQWASDPVNLAHYYTDPASTQWSLDGSLGHSLSLQNLIDFAKSQNKPIAVVETGAGNTADGAGVLDNPTFVQWLSSTLNNSGVAVEFVNIWDSNGGGNYEFSTASDGKLLEAAAWAKYFGAQTIVAAPPAAIALGSGGDSVVLHLAENAYQGDAQYTISVDGKQIGNTLTETALKTAGLSQQVTVKGNWGNGQHTVSVNFLNDDYGGSVTTDRNLYVVSASYDGITDSSNTLSLMSAGSQTLIVGVPAAPVISGLTAATDTGWSTTDNITSDATPTVTGTAQAGCTVKLLNAAGLLLGSTIATSSGAWSIAVSATLPNGTNVIAATSTASGDVSSASANSDITVNSVPPTVIAVSSSISKGGTLAVGQTDVLSLTTSEAVKVTGAPVLTLSDGGVATYDLAKSTTSFLAFDYIPTAGQVSANLLVSGLNLNGSLVTDLAGNMLTGASIPSLLDSNTGVLVNSPKLGAVTLGLGPDMVAIKISEQAWQGNAQFILSVDGVQIGGTQTATASHAAGQDQIYDVEGNFGPGKHAIAIDFLNDAFGGTASADRNLYVDGISYNATPASPGTLTLLGDGTQSLTVGIAVTAGLTEKG